MPIMRTGTKKNTKSHLEKKSGGQRLAKQQRREEAEARQAVRDAMSRGEKLALVASRRGESKKESMKLRGYHPLQQTVITEAGKAKGAKGFKKK